MSNTCLQYYYPNEELSKKYNIKCSKKFFNNLDNIDYFNNEDFLKFIKDNYSDLKFDGDSPYSFSNNYIKQSNEEICDPKEFSLKPQQKFMGQIINPDTNIKSSLIFHGLGSGKTCTSLVIGEAFKKTSPKKLLYVVPAPLVDQYYEEIIGELRNGEIWSCTSQCVINGKRDFYTNVNDKLILQFLEFDYNNKRIELNKLSDKITNLLRNKEDSSDEKKLFSKIQNELNIANTKFTQFKVKILSEVSKVFEIIGHDKFINRLFNITKDGKWTKMEYLTNQNSPLLNNNCLLVIDEIQRLVSEKGVLYKKLFTAVYQYFHPDLRIVLLSATPIYDNPYELALTMNLLKPRIVFPLNKDKFYSFFMGEIDTDGKCNRIKGQNWITLNSCLINKELLSYMCSGYVSYFKGGNPNAYPYKRIITLEHIMSKQQKEMYINALKSDLLKDSDVYSKVLSKDEFILSDNTDLKDDKISGIYVTTQQFSNIVFPLNKSDIIDSLVTKKSETLAKSGLDTFKKELKKLKSKSSEEVLNYIREKGYSQKFVSITDLTLNCDGPVFIFSNWLQFGVEALSVILNACGLTKYPEEDKGRGRYFIWSSETSSQKELISKAKSTYNSFENRDGSLLKVILGTRSIMEGVSFKNVKQVHITDPWWNEARIEQILARAVRFCSHSRLPLPDQYTDIFRHYSILPLNPDPDVEEMLLNTFGKKRMKNFESITIEQKMLTSALKKAQINNEFEETLRETSYDCELNKFGNIVRLEENIKPTGGGKYQIYYKNPATLEIYLRDSIPSEITYSDIIDRKYSYPNIFPIKFTEAGVNDYGILEEYTDSPKIIIEPEIDSNLNLLENIKCWNNNKIFKDIQVDPDIRTDLINITNNFSQLNKFKTTILQKTGTNTLKYLVDKQFAGKMKLMKCLKDISESDKTDNKQKKLLQKMLKNIEAKQIMNEKIYDLIYKYNIFPESMIEELQLMDSKTINSVFIEAQNNY